MAAGTSLFLSVYCHNSSKTGSLTYLSLQLVITWTVLHIHVMTPNLTCLTFDTQHNKRFPRTAVFTPLQTSAESSQSDLISSTMWLLVFLACLVIWAGGTYWYLFGKRRPFSLESLRPPGPREFDQKKRDKVLKQGKICVVGNAWMQRHT